MRIYIIGNEGITLYRKAPATVNDGEIAVAYNEELHTAPLGAKRLLALWDTLPGVEKRKKVGDRDALIDQLWSAIEALPDPEPQPDPKPPTKQDVVIAMLRLPEGATVDEVASVTGWQRHTVRGVFSGTLKKKLGLTLASAKGERGRVYRIAEPASPRNPHTTTLRLASARAGRPAVHTTAGRTGCEVWRRAAVARRAARRGVARCARQANGTGWRGFGSWSCRPGGNSHAAGSPVESLGLGRR